MATERLIIEVKEKGAATAKKNIAGIGQGATQAGAGVQLLKRALVALGGAAAIRQLVSLVDTFTNIQNKLRLVTKGTADLNAVTGQLLKIANRTRSSFEGTAELFARTARATKDLGVSQKEVLQFTESLNQAVILSGAGAIEAEQGIRQLSQGLAKGRLDGDELRSVLENLSFVGDILAEKMGVARGALRDLGAAGKITPTIIIGAFKAAREELEERFAKTVPTIGQSFQVLQNNILALTGVMEKNSGIAGLLSRTILTLSKHVDTLARVLGAAGLLGVVFLLRIGFTALNKQIRIFFNLLLANPVGALAKALLVVVSLLITFADKINIGSNGFGGLTTLADVAVGVWNVLSETLSTVIAKIQSLFSASESGATGIGAITSGLKLLGSALLSFLNVPAQLLSAFVNLVLVSFKLLPDALEDIIRSAFQGLAQIVEDSVNFILRPVNAVREKLGFDTAVQFKANPINNPVEGAAERFSVAALDGIVQGLEKPTLFDKAAGRFGAAIDAAREQRLGQEAVDKASEENALKALGATGPVIDRTEVAKTKGKTFADIKKELEQENALLRLNSVERERQAAIFQAETTLKRSLTAAEKAELGALLDLNAQLAVRADILDELQAPQIELAQGQAALNGLLADGTITAEQYNVKLRQLSLAALQADRSMEGGLKRGLLSIGEEFTNLSTLVESTLVNAFQGAEDALVSFVQTGKLDFKSLVDSIFADLARIAVRGAITGPIAGLLSGQAQGTGGGGGAAGGGILAGITKLFGSGGGGSTAAPTGGSAGGTGTLAGLAALGANLAFRNGGNFNVGGSGGPDSQLVAFRASPGENVQINKPGQGGGRSIVVNMNISTPDADSFQRNQTQILAKTQASLQRANSRNN
jgi:lambda family phage tail tape measure protein